MHEMPSRKGLDMSLEYEIPLRFPYSLRIRTRPMGDIEMRIWKRTENGSTSMPSGFFLSPDKLDQVIEALMEIRLEVPTGGLISKSDTFVLTKEYQEELARRNPELLRKYKDFFQEASPQLEAALRVVPPYREKPIPQELIDERWSELNPRLKHCRTHNTYFDPPEEPCWACYNEVQLA